MAELIFKEEAYRIIGACFEVYKQMGVGFLEAVYQECLAIEFAESQVPFVAQLPLELHYRGILLVQKYVPDFVCYGGNHSGTQSGSGTDKRTSGAGPQLSKSYRSQTRIACKLWTHATA